MFDMLLLFPDHSQKSLSVRRLLRAAEGIDAPYHETKTKVELVMNGFFLFYKLKTELLLLSCLNLKFIS